MESGQSADAAVIGGGVVGCAIALELARAGVRTVVLERSAPGAEASSAAVGILGQPVDATTTAWQLELGARSREMHGALAGELRDTLGIDVGFRRSGMLLVALDTAQRNVLASRVRVLEQGRCRFEMLDGAAARELEPSLAPDVVAAIDLPDEAQIDPPLLVRALALAAERAGAQIRSGACAQRIVSQDNRIQGVALDDGSMVNAGHVIVAAGSWTTLIDGVTLRTDAIRPVRGQVIACETRPPVFRRIVVGGAGYVVARPDGRTLCGSTEEDAGFMRDVTLGGIASIASACVRLAPGLASAPVRTHWAGFRPATPDGLPLVGPLGPEGLIVASGHFRNGILLAPITARVVADLVHGRAASIDLAPFDPRRFDIASAAGDAAPDERPS